MTHYSRIAAGLVGFIAASLLSAHADILDDTILAQMQKRGIPGVSIAIVQDGKIVRAQGYGVIEAGGKTPVTAATLFQAASISKPVSALGALRLVEMDKLALDADVNTALKSWKVPENEFTATEKVTLRRVLSHTAGLTVSGFLGYAPDAARPTLLQVLTGEKPANTPAIRVDLSPGAQFRYSGGGYVVLQQLVIDVTGQAYPDFMRETVLKPLGMLASTFEQPLPPTLATNAATAHGPNLKPFPGRWVVHPEIAPAGLWTTPSDLARFAIAMQHALAGKYDTVISPATARLMVTPVKNRMGLGFLAAGAGSTERFTFNGRNQGFDSQFVAYRDGGSAAVVMINTNDRSSFFPRVMAAIAQTYGWADYPPYAPPAPIEDKEPEVTAQIRNVVEQAQQGLFDRDLFTAPLAEVFAVEVRRDESLRRLQGYGALKSIALVGRQTSGPNRNYRYLVLFEKESALLTCSYKEGKISAFSIGPD